MSDDNNTVPFRPRQQTEGANAALPTQSFDDRLVALFERQMDTTGQLLTQLVQQHEQLSKQVAISAQAAATQFEVIGAALLEIAQGIDEILSAQQVD